MTGPEHYRAAEASLDAARDAADGGLDSEAAFCQGEAQVHATLALAAATADPFTRGDAWAQVTQ